VNGCTTTYDAYHSTRDLFEDESLTHVGRGTPGGEFHRRFWTPVAFTQDVKDLPLKLRILGEDLVLFRTNRGEYGLVEQRCSHRGASLEYGVISEQGIRCAYHGFHYAPDGTILETGAGAPLANGGRICHGAYPLINFHDLLFAYMGPPEKKPPFPMLDIYDNPNIEVLPGPDRACVNDCNWLQVAENGMDPVHTAFLHAILTGTQRGFSDQVGVIPVMQWVNSDVGMNYIACRRIGENVWVRVNDQLLPSISIVPPSDQRAAKADISEPANHATWVVPIDDFNSKRLHLLFNDARNPLNAQHRQRGEGQENDRSYIERQRRPGDYEMMTSQGSRRGPIGVHGYENLTTTDYGVIGFRKMVRDGIRAVAEGRDPIGISRDPDFRIPSRGQNTIVRVPPAATPEAERELLLKVGLEVLESDRLRTLQPV
jgi:phenylpropionate dioxygenase-like ring-hydroxylating dioxygenase large terminal subunit